MTNEAESHTTRSDESDIEISILPESDSTSYGVASDAGFFLSSSNVSYASGSFTSTHTDHVPPSSSYNQLIDYLNMLSVTMIPSSDVALGDALGAGATLVVQKAVLRHQFARESVVAVKTPRENIHRSPYVLRSLLKEILNEVRVMTHLSRNPHVATLLGIVLEEKDSGLFLPRLVVELAVGSLGSLLHRYHLPWSLKLKFCMETAAGLEALHMIQIVHSDVKADNILIFLSNTHWDMSRTPQLVAAVSDFGFCVPDASERDSLSSRGTLRFKAPEALHEALPDLRVHANRPERDIYSFGVFVWEVITDGQLPFEGVSDEDVPGLQLASQDAAALHLLAAEKHFDRGIPRLAPFLTVIQGTVRRHPFEDGGRMSWQGVQDTLAIAADDNCVSPDPDKTLVEYFTDKSSRQAEYSWSIFHQFPWLPITLFLSDTSQTTDAYSTLMVQELEEFSTNQLDGTAILRLALHFFQIGDQPSMKALLKTFGSSEPNISESSAAALLGSTVKADAIDIVDALLRKVPMDVNSARDEYGLTPLHIAQSAAVAQLLIDHGHDVNAPSYKFTPLYHATSGEVAETLLKNGAHLGTTDGRGWTALHSATSSDVVHALVRHGADPLAKDKDGNTPLHGAISDETAFALMNLSSDALHAVNSVGRTPLHARIDIWTSDVVRKALEYGANPSAVDSSGNTPLAYCHSNFGSALVLVNSGADFRPSPQSSWPLPHGITDPDVLDLFCKHGGTTVVNSQDRAGRTGLHLVADRDFALLVSYSEEGSRLPLHQRRAVFYPARGVPHLLRQSSLVRSVQMAKIYLEHGADPNIPDGKLNTTLHFVARTIIGYEGHEESIGVMRLLLNAGADVSATNIYGETPLHLAGRAESIFALLEAGADPRLQDKEGVTILHNLLRFGGSCEQVVEALIAHGADIEARDLNGFTPLHYACRSYEEGSRAMKQLERWTESTAPSDGMSPASSEMTMIVQGKQTRLEALKALVGHGASVNALAYTGRSAFLRLIKGQSFTSPLQLLARHPFAPEEYQFLVSHGATLSMRPGGGSVDMDVTPTLLDEQEFQAPWWTRDQSKRDLRAEWP